MSLQLTTNLLSKLSKNVNRKQTNPIRKTRSGVDSKLLVANNTSRVPPRKCFDPCKEFREIRAEMSSFSSSSSTRTQPSSSLSSSSSSSCRQYTTDSSPDRTTSDEEEDFYQTLNRRNEENEDVGADYDYLASYHEWPTSQSKSSSSCSAGSKPASPPLPPPASTQPSRTQAILKFYDYY